MVHWDHGQPFRPFYASRDCRSGLRKSSFWQACGLHDQYLPSTTNPPPEKAVCYDITDPPGAEGMFALERSDRFYFIRVQIKSTSFGLVAPLTSCPEKNDRRVMLEDGVLSCKKTRYSAITSAQSKNSPSKMEIAAKKELGRFFLLILFVHISDPIKGRR